jgi:hypothetical protein
VTNQVQLSDAHRQYLRSYAITDERIELSGAYSNGNRLVFPWRDGDQTTEQFKENPERKGGKYIWEKGEPQHLWCHRDAGPESPVLLVEGTKQSLAAACWTPLEYSVYGMSGCEGAARVNLRRFGGRKIVVVLDADSAENLNVYEAGAALANRLHDRGATVLFLQLNARGSDGLDDVLARDWDEDERAGYMTRKIAEATPKPAPRKPTARKQRSSDAITLPDTGGREGVAVNQDRGEVIDKITTALVERAGGRSLFNYGKVITKVQGSSTKPLPEGDFLKMLTEHVACYHYKAPTSSSPAVFDPAWPDGQTVKAVMSESSATAFPELERVVRTPFLREDGTICVQDGYDADTKTVLVTGGLDVTEVTGSPSPEGIRLAVKFLMEEWLGDFPFETPADRANVLAAVLTPFIRGLVPLAPLCVVSGTGPGVGKNLLADNISVLVTGEAATPLPYVQDEDETRKQLTATFRTGSEMFIFDEAHQIAGANLARALTGRTWSDRVLGSSTMVEYPNKVTWMALGNQTQVMGDLYRRVYFVHIGGDERSHDREGHEYRHQDLTGWARENRPKLVMAVLTLLRGWVAAGRPGHSRGATMGSFEAWDRMLSGICAFAGYPEFLTDAKERRSESDLFGSYWAAHMEWLASKFSGRTFTTAEVRAAAVTNPDTYEAPMGLDDASDKGYARKLGQHYAQVKGRFFGGFKLIKAGMGHKSTSKWQIVASTGGMEGTEGTPTPTRDVRKHLVCAEGCVNTCLHVQAGGRGIPSVPAVPSIEPPRVPSDPWLMPDTSSFLVPEALRWREQHTVDGVPPRTDPFA